MALVYHMPNLFDYFDCRPGTALAPHFAVGRLVLLSNDFHLRMDCILLKCSILVRYGRQLVEQLDPISLQHHRFKVTVLSIE